MVAVDRLRQKARDYELNALAQADAGNETEARAFSAIAIVLFEVADTLDEDLEDAA